MPKLRRVLQEAWRQSRDRWRSASRAQCLEWKSLSRADTDGTLCRPKMSAPSLSAERFLKCQDDWSSLSQDAKAFSEFIAAEKSAAESFFVKEREIGESAKFASEHSIAYTERNLPIEIVKLQAEGASLVPNEEIIPEAQGSFMYFQRPTVDGYIQFGRYPKDQPQAEEVILDTSALAKGIEGTGIADIIACKVSDDHKLLAYIIDPVGDDSFELHVRPAASSWEEFVRIPGIRSVEFVSESKDTVNLLAVRTDATTKRANQLLHLQVAGESVLEHLLWEEENQAAYLELFKTKNRKFILASSNTKDTSDVRYLRCGDMGRIDVSTLLQPVPGVEYFAEHLQDFFVISNHERPDFAVYLLSENQAGRPDSWSQLKHFFTPPGEMHVTDADLLSGWLVLYGHEAAAPRICVVPVREPQKAYLVDLPSIGSVEPGVNAENNADHIRFTFRSPVEPGCTYDLDLSGGMIKTAGKRRLKTGIISSDSVECTRVFFMARDGEQVPMTLLQPSNQLQSGPCLLHVYGAYGSCMAPDFRPEHLMLLRRGWVLAWAHVRGGGERGWAWHQAGRQQRKSRSVLDLADAVRFLLSRNLVAPGALCLKGSSAGGFTLGALLNSPEDASLIGAAIMEVPFLDVLNSMADPLLPLTAHEFAEWGDPRKEEHERNIRSLSPYENIGSHSYPHLYLSCALADSRAPAWMTVKYAARVRSRTPGYMSKNTGARRRFLPEPQDNTCILQSSDAGHAGGADWNSRSEEFARQVAFLHRSLGVRH